LEMLHRWVAALVLISVVTAPPVERIRLFCRWTGEEISPNACQDEAGSEGPGVLPDRCCDHRVQAPLPAAKADSIQADPALTVAVVVQLEWFEAFQSAPAERKEAPPLLRPPLSETRILLI
jgi:hypothetical protein